MAKQLRPIALTNGSYKMYMNLIKDEIEEHLQVKGASMEMQAGFTSGGKVEDNLSFLNTVLNSPSRSKKKKTL